MYVKLAFLTVDIKDEGYVPQPPRFKLPHLKNKVYELKKALYVVKQTPRALYY